MASGITIFFLSMSKLSCFFASRAISLLEIEPNTFPSTPAWILTIMDLFLRSSAKALAEDLKNKSIIVRIQAGVEGKVFGSISSKEIALEAKKQLNLDIDKKKIVIPDAIKSLGTYNVNIKLHKDVTGTLAVKVVAK